jgi:dihydrofolate reductase
MKITLVAAIASNNVIGYKNSLPWNIPSDLKKFKELTSGKTILMGRKTFDSIGKPLPNRTNIVMTRDSNFMHEGIEVVSNMDDALNFVKKSEEVFVIGGSAIYKIFEPIASSLAITHILKDFKGDAFFPEINWGLWEVESEDNFLDEKSGISCNQVKYKRKS